jgi:hypothetical protein
MGWKELDEKLMKSDRYKFFQKHQRLWIFIQGFIVIGLLIGVVLFMVQDRVIKEQIRDNCGYETDTYECVCTPHAIGEYNGEDIIINLTGNGDDELVR